MQNSLAPTKTFFLNKNNINIGCEYDVHNYAEYLSVVCLGCPDMMIKSQRCLTARTGRP